MFQRVIQRSKSHLAFIILSAVLAIYLGAKAFPEEGWSGWGIFAAQTMLSNDNWAKDGFFGSRLLYIPIGHSKITKLLDEPELRHHARGTVTGGLIGRRLYYTHYPVGYVFPYALMRKAGVTERHWFRLMSLGFSFAALALMYAAFNNISTPAAAFFGVLYYAGSTMFLDFADALNNQAVDDFFRFLILFISVLALRHRADRERLRRYNIALWALFFLLSLSSYDSIFYVFVWIIGLDLIGYFTGAGLRAWSLLKRWAVFSIAPVAGFLLQVLQNWWYLGFEDMVLDFKGAFFSRATAVQGGGGLSERLTAMLTPLFNATNMDPGVAIPVIIITAALFLYVKGRLPGRWPGLSHIITMVLAGAAFIFVFSYTAKFFDYQGRQFSPFLGLLFGASTVMVIRFFKAVFSRERHATATKAACLLLIAPLAFVWYTQAGRTVKYIKAWPNHAEPIEKIDFYRTLKSMSEPENTVVFFIDPAFTVDYPQPSPIDEFYLGGTILNFRGLSDMERDYRLLKERSKAGFRPLIVSPERAVLESFASDMALPGEIRQMTDYYYVLVAGQGGEAS